MEKTKHLTWWRSIPVELLLAVLAASGALIVNGWYYEQEISFRHGIVWMIRYFAFGNGYFLWFALLLYGLFLKKFYIKTVELLEARFIQHRAISRTQLFEALYLLWHPFYVLLPLSIVAGPFSTLLANISYNARFTQLDLLFLKLDYALFGGSPFLLLPRLFPYDWVAFLLVQCYLSLSIGISAMFVCLYFFDVKRLFRQAVIAFILTLVIAYPFFYMFPCQAPGNFFIRNIRGYQFPPDIEQIRQNYTASALTRQVITTFSESEINYARDKAVPISCFPSMHSTWALLVIYFLARVRTWSLFFTIPWTLLLITGGVYFAQHYAVDYLAAIPVAALAIILAHFLLKWEEQ